MVPYISLVFAQTNEENQTASCNQTFVGQIVSQIMTFLVQRIFSEDVCYPKEKQLGPSLLNFWIMTLSLMTKKFHPVGLSMKCPSITTQYIQQKNKKEENVVPFSCCRSRTIGIDYEKKRPAMRPLRPLKPRGNGTLRRRNPFSKTDMFVYCSIVSITTNYVTKQFYNTVVLGNDVSNNLIQWKIYIGGDHNYCWFYTMGLILCC